MVNTIKKLNEKLEINKKKINLYLNNLVYNNLNNSNIHFFITINFKKNITIK